jgi:hypothetical protein
MATINNPSPEGEGVASLLIGEQSAADALPSALSRLLRRTFGILNLNPNITQLTLQVLHLFAQLTPNRCSETSLLSHSVIGNIRKVIQASGAIPERILKPRQPD